MPASISLNNNTKGIADYAFLGGRNTSVTIPDGVTIIGEGAFQACMDIASVTIPASVTTIRQVAFEACSSLTSVTFNGTIRKYNNDTNTGFDYRAFGYTASPYSSGYQGDLYDKFYATDATNGTPGTYTRVLYSSESDRTTWTRQN